MRQVVDGEFTSKHTKRWIVQIHFIAGLKTYSIQVIAALLKITQTRYKPNVNWSMDKLWYIRIKDYHSAIKRNQLLTHTTS